MIGWPFWKVLSFLYHDLPPNPLHQMAGIINHALGRVHRINRTAKDRTPRRTAAQPNSFQLTAHPVATAGHQQKQDRNFQTSERSERAVPSSQRKTGKKKQSTSLFKTNRNRPLTGKSNRILLFLKSSTWYLHFLIAEKLVTTAKNPWIHFCSTIQSVSA